MIKKRRVIKFTEADIALINKLYLNGMGVASIAIHLKLPHTRVYVLVKKAGLIRERKESMRIAASTGNMSGARKKGKYGY